MVQPPFPLHTYHREVLHQNPYWSYCKDRYGIKGSPASTENLEADYFYAHTPGSVLVVPITEQGEWIVVRQDRYLMQRTIYEFPGGGVQPAQTPLEAAQQELQEETGLLAQRWEKLGEFNPCKGLTDENCTVYLAQQLSSVASGSEDPFELLQAVICSEKQIEDWIDQGDFACGMSLAAWTLARRYEGGVQKS
ncbi:MAG: NUDIX hydrolase [Gloeobacterales cyanobacterium]